MVLISLPYVLVSVIASDSAVFITLALVYICVSVNLLTVSCMCVFYYGFEVIRQKLLQAANMSYSDVCFSVHGSGACDQTGLAKEQEKSYELLTTHPLGDKQGF